MARTALGNFLLDCKDFFNGAPFSWSEPKATPPPKTSPPYTKFEYGKDFQTFGEMFDTTFPSLTKREFRVSITDEQLVRLTSGKPLQFKADGHTIHITRKTPDGSKEST